MYSKTNQYAGYPAAVNKHFVQLLAHYILYNDAGRVIVSIEISSHSRNKDKHLLPLKTAPGFIANLR